MEWFAVSMKTFCDLKNWDVILGPKKTFTSFVQFSLNSYKPVSEYKNFIGDKGLLIILSDSVEVKDLKKN